MLTKYEYDSKLLLTDVCCTFCLQQVIALLEEVFPAGFSQDTDGLMHRHARSQSLSNEDLGTLLGSSCTGGVETCVYQVNLSQAAAAVKVKS